jgi:hypothetical protein
MALPLSLPWARPFPVFAVADGPHRSPTAERNMPPQDVVEKKGLAWLTFKIYHTRNLASQNLGKKFAIDLARKI